MKKVLLFVVIGLLLLAIPATIYFLGQQRDIRTRAAPATTLSLSPAAPSVKVGDTVKLSVIMTPGANQVVSADIYLTYDATKLTATAITNGPSAPRVLNSGVVGNGTASIRVGAASNAQPITTAGPIAVITFTATNPTTAIAPATVQFASNTFVGGLSEATANVLVGTVGAKITIDGGTTISATPTAAISSATAKTCSDNLSDDFNNSSLDGTKWGFNPGLGDILGKATISNNQLVMTYPNINPNTYPNESKLNTTAGLVTTAEISGNFDSTVDFINQTISPQPPDAVDISGERFGIISVDRKNRVTVMRNSDNHIVSNRIVNDDPDPSPQISIPTFPGIVTVRITRDGSSIKTYFKENNKYTLLGDYPNIISGNAVIKLSVTSEAPLFPHVTGTFDNFVLSCISPPTPSITPAIPATGSAQATSSALTILPPSSDGSSVSAQPVIQGKAPPGSTVTIVIHSDPITVVVTADANGNYIYTPTTPLAAGLHEVNVSIQTASGSTVTKSDSFVVAQGGTTSTESAIPVTGNIETTILIIVAGMLLFTSGAVLWLF